MSEEILEQTRKCRLCGGPIPADLPNYRKRHYCSIEHATESVRKKAREAGRIKRTTIEGREKLDAANKKWRNKDIENFKAIRAKAMAKWQKKNKEKLKMWRERWAQKKHQCSWGEYCRRRYAVKKALEGQNDSR